MTISKSEFVELYVKHMTKSISGSASYPFERVDYLISMIEDAEKAYDKNKLPKNSGVYHIR